MFSVFLRRHSILLFKSTVKDGIVFEAGHQISLADLLAAQYGIPAHQKPFPGNILMDRKTEIHKK